MFQSVEPPVQQSDTRRRGDGSEAEVAPLPITLNDEQLGKVQSELDVVNGNIKVLDEMLAELKPDKEHHPQDLQLLHVCFHYSGLQLCISCSVFQFFFLPLHVLKHDKNLIFNA